ncbi:IL6RB protein, partial [Phaetusa simplex]|nr:IL6RB protein [Phaetusa simplex]
MFSGWNWVAYGLYLLLNFCSLEVSGGLVQSCGHIIPESPVLALGSNFTALCILNESCLDFGNIYANQIIWKIKNKVVPKEQYREINRTVSSVTFNDTSSLATPLTCNILADGQIEQNIYGIAVTIGLPPEKPKNLSCIVHQVSKLTYPMIFTQNPGRYMFLDTHFRLKYRWASNCSGIGSSTGCKWISAPLWTSMGYRGTACLAMVFTMDFRGISAPVAGASPPPPSSLTLPSLFCGTNPQHCKVAAMHQSVHITTISSTWLAFLLLVMLQSAASTELSVLQVCCVALDSFRFLQDSGTETVTALTLFLSSEPSKGPPIWRIIDASRSPAFWTVRLMWKALEPFEANGIILQYEVTVRAKSSLSSTPEKYNINTTNLILKLPNGTYEVTLIARNRVGASPPSVLLIPATNSKAPVKNVRTLPKDGKLWVGWTAPNSYVLKYVIEWCLVSNSSDCIIEWQNEPGNVQGTYLKGDIKPFKCYLITVYSLYADGQGSGQSVKAYLQQDRKYKIKSSINFFLSSAVTVDPSKTEYTLSSLTSDTLYTVRMMAYTDEGGRSGPDFTFTTQKFGKGEIEAIVVPVCLAFLLIVLLGVLFCFNKRDLIKKHIWPIVPDPSKSNIAQWSPQVPAKHNFSSKDQMYPEGSFTDVSVVEIEADDKKSFSEQDLKPFDLLKKEKSTSEGHSSGIGGSSCMSSPRQSVSDSDEGETTQNTSSTVQYSTVVLNGYRDQTPVQVFSRSESTQPLLDSEERSEDHSGGGDSTSQRQQYFKQNGGQDETNTDRPCFERTKQITPTNEGDLVGFAQLQISDQSSQLLGLGLEKNTQEAALPDVLQTSIEGQTVRPETVEGNPPSADEMPKSYLPQTVRQGGYMPQ